MRATTWLANMLYLSGSPLLCRSLQLTWKNQHRSLKSKLNASTTVSSSKDSTTKGKLLVLGGTGFLGQNICKRAVLEGYQVTSVSRRGLPPSSSETSPTTTKIDYRQGDLRKKETVGTILAEGGYMGVIHCVGLLFDEKSGLASYNRFVSGSGSLPDSDSTYDSITRLTAFNAIESSIEYAKKSGLTPFPFMFTSAAEAGWPDVPLGPFIENNLAPDFLKRYLAAKRLVEAKLLATEPDLRPIIARPSLIYTMDRPSSFPSVAAFVVGNRIGLPFVDRPVTVQALSAAIVRAMSDSAIKGILRYPQIEDLSSIKS